MDKSKKCACSCIRIMLRLCCDPCVLFRHVVQAFLELSNQIMEELCRLGSLVHDIMLLLLELVIDDANFLALQQLEQLDVGRPTTYSTARFTPRPQTCCHLHRPRTTECSLRKLSVVSVQTQAMQVMAQETCIVHAFGAYTRKTQETKGTPDHTNSGRCMAEHQGGLQGIAIMSNDALRKIICKASLIWTGKHTSSRMVPLSRQNSSRL